MAQARADGPLECRRNAGQGVAEAVGEPREIGGQVDVEAVEHPELLQQLVAADVEPVHLAATHPGGVGDHEGISRSVSASPGYRSAARLMTRPGT